MKLNNNKILITGGNSGIGCELTKQFYRLNNKVIITGRNKNRLKKVKEELPDIEIFKCDLTDASDMDQLMAFLMQNHQDLNILVNNAGVQYNYPFSKEKDLPEKIENEVQVNLSSPIKLTASCLPIIQQNGSGAIVNVSSALGFVPKQSAPVYCGTKAGIHIFSKALRYQLENTKTKVFEVIPALVDTPMTKGRGKNKISPEELVTEFLKAFEKDVFEVNIGKVKILRILHRIFPGLAEKLLKKN